MNSGKSTALMQVAHNYAEQGMRVLILKPQVDTKGGGELVSRLGVRRRADLIIPPEVDVFEAVRAASAGEQPLACVLCDESQPPTTLASALPMRSPAPVLVRAVPRAREPTKSISISQGMSRRADSVSYTHLDVYKRQVYEMPSTAEAKSNIHHHLHSRSITSSWENRK